MDFKYGLACFVKKDCKSEELGCAELPENKQERKTYFREISAGLLQVVKVDSFVLANIHGLWEENSKKHDTEVRFEQLKIINNFLDTCTEQKIICGDLNVLPETDFLKDLESRYKNMVTEFDVTSTRSSLYDKDMRFADYFLTDKNVPVRKCYTENVTVSDHLPIILNVK